MSENHHTESNPYKVGFYILLICILVTGAAVIALRTVLDLPGIFTSNTPIVIPTLIPEQPKMATDGAMQKGGLTATASPQYNLEQGGEKDLVYQGENTVSYARANEKVLLKYRGKIYDESNQNSMEPVKNLNAADFKWYGLVDAPADVKPNEFMYDEVFGLKTAPNGKDFVFIMRWGKNVNDVAAIDYNLYTFTDGKLTLKKFTQAPTPGYDIPKIDAFSEDGSRLSLMMYGCWNCGGNPPETGLLNLQNMAYTTIGKTSMFTWTSTNSYNYKEYKKIECAEPGPGECSEKPENMPLKTGTF
jgi:hypothetical protein